MIDSFHPTIICILFEAPRQGQSRPGQATQIVAPTTSVKGNGGHLKAHNDYDYQSRRQTQMCDCVSLKWLRMIVAASSTQEQPDPKQRRPFQKRWKPNYSNLTSTSYHTLLLNIYHGPGKNSLNAWPLILSISDVKMLKMCSMNCSSVHSLWDGMG